MGIKTVIRQTRDNYLHKQYEKEYLSQKELYQTWIGQNETEASVKQNSLNPEYMILQGKDIVLSDREIYEFNKIIEEEDRILFIQMRMLWMPAESERIRFLNRIGHRIHF